jgi:uncharacterized iron-regulated protein
MKKKQLIVGGRSAGILLLIAAAGGCATATVGPAGLSPTPTSDYRIYDTSAQSFLDLPTLVERLASADLVFFGEMHDDAVAHRLQLELLEHLAMDTTWTALGLEMFERDVQPSISRYLAGEMSEESFLAGSRPWPNYRSDYRPLLQAAASHGWIVAGTNLPQSLASAVARYGIETLATLDLDTRRLAAAQFDCPEDEYWLKFLEAMRESTQTDPGAHAEVDPLLKRTYEAQCARDETMAETIASLLPEGGVMHVNGAFHSDFRLGIVPRLLRRAPSASIQVISAFPVDDLADPPIDEHLARADFLILTRSGEN